MLTCLPACKRIVQAGVWGYGKQAWLSAAGVNIIIVRVRLQVKTVNHAQSLFFYNSRERVFISLASLGRRLFIFNISMSKLFGQAERQQFPTRYKRPYPIAACYRKEEVRGKLLIVIYSHMGCLLPPDLPSAKMINEGFWCFIIDALDL